MSLHAAQRIRSFFRERDETATSVVTARDTRPTASARNVTMSITVDAGVVALLRRVIMNACGERIEIMRVKPVIRTNDMRVSIGLHSSAVSAAMEAVMRLLPRAEFGRITAL